MYSKSPHIQTYTHFWGSFSLKNPNKNRNPNVFKEKFHQTYYLTLCYKLLQVFEMKKNFVIVLKIIFNIDANILNKILKARRSPLIVSTKNDQILRNKFSKNCKKSLLV